MPPLVVEEESSRSAGFRLTVDLVINVLENARLGRRRAFISELGRGVCFFFKLGVYGFELFIAENLFAQPGDS